MDVVRGDIWWADLPVPRGSEPGFRRPVIIVQANTFNRSTIRTVLVLAISGNDRLRRAAGNVTIPPATGGLSRPSVANVSQLFTLDRRHLVERVGRLPKGMREEVDEGLRLVLELGPI